MIPTSFQVRPLDEGKWRIQTLAPEKTEYDEETHLFDKVSEDAFVHKSSAGTEKMYARFVKSGDIYSLVDADGKHYSPRVELKLVQKQEEKPVNNPLYKW